MIALVDIRHALRGLRRTPLFTVSTIAALAIGIGATTALFSVVNTLLLKPLPYPEADRLALVWEHNLPRNRTRNVVSPANFLEWKARNRSFEILSAFTPNRVTITGTGDPEEVPSVTASSDFLDAVGVPPMLGRGFAEGEDQEGADPVVVLGHGLWQRRFGGDPGIVGQAITVNSRPATVIGVMPQGFEILGTPPDLITPFRLGPAAREFRGRSILTMGRLKPGVTRDQAQAEMAGIMAQLVDEQPDFNTGWTVNVVPLREQLVGEVRPAVLVLFVTVGAVLLIACGNIGSLMLTRASGRRREIAVRSALGAGTGRLVGQLLFEALLLSAAGGVGGVLLGGWLLSTLTSWVATRLPVPLLSQMSMDPAVLLFAAGATIVTAAACGVVPALGATGGSLVAALRDGAPSLSSSPRASVIRQVLVAGEIALALTVLCGAGVLGRSLAALQQVDPGFKAESALSLRVTLPSQRYRGTDAEHAFHVRVMDGLRALPGVRSVGGISFLPLASTGPATSFWRADRPQPSPTERPVTDARPVTPGFFETMGIPLLAGRDLQETDTADRPPVAVINETFARQIFPGESPIGRTFILNLGKEEPHEIIGVVGDVKLASLDGEVRPTCYLSSRQYAFGIMSYVVRTAGDPGALAPAAVRVVRDVDPLLPVAAVRPLEEVFAESIARPRLTATAMALFATAALLLAAIGVYGVVGYSVAQRSREFGIRVALGARSGDIIRMVVAQNLRLVVAGLVVGLACAIPGTRLLRGLLYQVGPNDPLTFVAIGVVLAAVAVVASYLPARRGTRIDPIVTLRSE